MTSHIYRCAKGWVQLLRPPNLLTVPGDPVSGFLLAVFIGNDRALVYMLPVAGVSLFIYIAGLISNDCFDYREDLKQRPCRPLPSGSVSRRAAVCVSVLAGAAGLLLACVVSAATCAAAACLVVLVLFYNSIGKRIPIVGSLSMGACRGTSLLVGAVAAGWRPVEFDVVMISALGITLYIAGVTSLASRETEEVPMPVRRWLPCIAVAACMVCLVVHGKASGVAFLVLAALSILWPCFQGYRLGSCPEPGLVIPTVGSLIRGLLLIQATVASLLLPEGGLIVGLLLLAFPLNAYLAKKFYAS